MGGTDSAQEGRFVWTDGTAWTYQNWTPGKPDNSGDEDFVLMKRAIDGGQWNDYTNNKLDYVTGYVK